MSTKTFGHEHEERSERHGAASLLPTEVSGQTPSVAVLRRVVDVIFITGRLGFVRLPGSKRARHLPKQARHRVGEDPRLSLHDAERHGAIFSPPGAVGTPFPDTAPSAGSRGQDANATG